MYCLMSQVKNLPHPWINFIAPSLIFGEGFFHQVCTDSDSSLSLFVLDPDPASVEVQNKLPPAAETDQSSKAKKSLEY